MKTKCSQTGTFVVTGFVDEKPGKIDHIRVAEIVEDELVECGQVRFADASECVVRRAPQMDTAPTPAFCRRQATLLRADADCTGDAEEASELRNLADRFEDLARKLDSGVPLRRPEQ